MGQENQEEPKLNRAGNRRGMNPNSIKNMQKAGTPSHNPNGRPEGQPDRARVLRDLMNIVVTRKNPKDPSKEKRFTLYEAAALGQLLSAEKGNTFAWKEIQDTLHGPIPTKIKGEIDFSFAGLAKAAAMELEGGHENEIPVSGNGNGFHPEENGASFIDAVRSGDDPEEEE